MNWQHYVIYMGASDPTLKVAESSYMQLLSSIIDPRFILIIFFFIIFFSYLFNFSHLYCIFVFASKESEKMSIVHNYHTFRGFSAMLTENQASVLSGTFSSLFILSLPK